MRLTRFLTAIGWVTAYEGLTLRTDSLAGWVRSLIEQRFDDRGGWFRRIVTPHRTSSSRR